MSRNEFMMQLEWLLEDVAEEEKKEALSYYRSYFEDAGVENEARILKELESPEKVAATIKADLGMGQAAQAGEYTERGSEDSRFEQKNPVDIRKSTEGQQSQGKAFGQGDTEPEMDFGNTEKEQYYSGYSSSNGGDGRSTYSGRSTAGILLIVAVAIVTSPVWLGLITGIGGALLGVAISAIAVTGAFYIAGGVLFGIGIGQIVTGGLAVGFALTGIGLLLLALAILGTVVCVWVCGKLLPWLCRLIGRVWNSVFSGKERRA